MRTVIGSKMARDIHEKVMEMSSKNKMKKGKNSFMYDYGHKKKAGCKGIRKLDFYTKQDRVEFKKKYAPMV